MKKQTKKNKSICGWVRDDVVTVLNQINDMRDSEDFLLTDDEIDNIFYRMENEFDANIGMNYSIIESMIYDYVNDN